MVPEDYVHRIGRTGRAGSPGDAISLVCVDELPLLAAIERQSKATIEREIVPGFEPDPSIRPQAIQLRSGMGRGMPRQQSGARIQQPSGAHHQPIGPRNQPSPVRSQLGAWPTSASPNSRPNRWNRRPGPRHANPRSQPQF